MFKYNLLEHVDTKSKLASFALENIIRVNPRIVGYLLNNDHISPRLSPVLKFVHPIQLIEDLFLPEDFTSQIDAFASSKSQGLFASNKTSIISLRGKEGAGQQVIAESICHRLGINMLIFDMKSLLANSSIDLSSILSTVQLEAMLQNAAVYWHNTYLSTKNDEYHHSLVEQLGRVRRLHFIALGLTEYFPFHQTKSTLIHLEIPNLTTNERFRLWQRAAPDLVGSDQAELA